MYVQYRIHVGIYLYALYGLQIITIVVQVHFCKTEGVKEKRAHV